jgi:putative ABC transport system permease protein
LPYPEPDRLMDLRERMTALGGGSFAYLNFLDCQRESRSFEHMAAWNFGDGIVTGPGEAEHVRGRQISAEFFEVLGVRPPLGRPFLPEEDRPGAAPVAIISNSLWRSRFGGDRRAAGGRLLFNGKPYTVVGILPTDFRFSRSAHVFTPIGQNDESQLRNREYHPGIRVIARVKPQVTLAQVRAELELIGRRLAKAYPESNAGHSFLLRPLLQDFIGTFAPRFFCCSEPWPLFS